MGERVVLDVVIRAPVTAAFAALTDWAAQDLWMVGTRVQITRGDGRSVGSQITAVTGRGPLTVVDAMDITGWDPPRRIDIRHTGPVVRGVGSIEVTGLPHDLCRVVWAEDFELPLRSVSRLGWAVVRPGLAAGLRRSLRTFGRLVETGVLPRTPEP